MKGKFARNILSAMVGKIRISKDVGINVTRWNFAVIFP